MIVVKCVLRCDARDLRNGLMCCRFRQARSDVVIALPIRQFGNLIWDGLRYLKRFARFALICVVIVSAADQSDPLQMSSENVQLDELREYVCRVHFTIDLCDLENFGLDEILHEQVREVNVTSFP